MPTKTNPVTADHRRLHAHHQSHHRRSGARRASLAQTMERPNAPAVASPAHCAITANPIQASISLLLWSEAVARGFYRRLDDLPSGA